MAKVAIFYLLFLFAFFHLPILIKSAEFYPLDYELYGPTLGANDQFIIAIQNRAGISFSAISGYSTSSPNYCSLNFIPTIGSELYAALIAVGRYGLAASNTNKFVFIAYSSNETFTYLIVASIAFSPCQLTTLYTATVTNASYPNYSVLGVNDGGTMAFYISDSGIYMQSLISPYTASIWMPIILPSPSMSFIPAGIDLRNTWGILGAYTRSLSGYSNYRATVYQVNFLNCSITFNATCFQLAYPYSITYSVSWQSLNAPANTFDYNDYNSLYDISISISDQGTVLFGVQSINTVFLFNASSSSLTFVGSRMPSTFASVGFGKGVGWLDNTTAAILFNNFTLDDTQWRSSTIQLYPITASNSLSNTIAAYASFPNSRQQLWSQLNSRLVNVLAVPATGSLICMDYVGNVYIILPSSSAYFAYTQDGIGKINNTIYIAPTLQCPSGTIKNLTASGKDIFRYCLLCPEGSFYSATGINTTNVCTPCDAAIQFCPWGSVANLPISVLDTISQAQVYPQSPENDQFEDILLINMFNVDFPTHCLAKQPLFYALTIIGIGSLFLLFMGILKLTGKFKKQRRMMKNIFKQTDLIGEGELWIGGVASLSIVIIAVFSYVFSNGFINQYPIEAVGDATFACDPTLRNAKFSTSMQSLGTPILEEQQPIFNMLNDQPFTLNVAFINTDFSDKKLNVSQVFSSYLLDLSRTTQVTDGLLSISTNLTSHGTTIIFNITSNSAVGAFRIGLTGPSMQNENYYVQELNFSYAFNYTNRTVTQDPMITLQLIKLINDTEPLSSNIQTLYSALWIPTFIKNDDQLFYTESDFQLYHVKDNTILTIEITEATYYIYNQQQPITKLTEIVFTDILFTTTCIELFALAFLFFKLAILPIIKKIIELCFGSNKITPKGNGGPGCPYCRSVDADALPAYRISVQRIQQGTYTYPVRRPNTDIVKLHSLSAEPAAFH